MAGHGRLSVKVPHGHSSLEEDPNIEINNLYGIHGKGETETSKASSAFRGGPLERQEDSAVTNGQTDSSSSRIYISVRQQDILRDQQDGVIIKKEVDLDGHEDQLCHISQATSTTQVRNRGRKRASLEEQLEDRSSYEPTGEGDAESQSSAKQRGRGRGRGRKPKRSVDSISLSLQSQLLQNNVQRETESRRKSSVPRRSTIQLHDTESSRLSESCDFDSDLLRPYASLIENSWPLPDSQDRAQLKRSWTVQHSYDRIADLTSSNTLSEPEFQASPSRSMLNKDMKARQSGGRNRSRSSGATSTMKNIRSWHVSENCGISTGLPYKSAPDISISPALDSTSASDEEESTGKGNQSRGGGRGSRRGKRGGRRGGKQPGRSDTKNNRSIEAQSEGEGHFINREEEIFDKCLRCGEEMGLLTTYEDHLMKKHAALYSKNCPEGEVDTNAVARQIIKKVGHVDCPECQKEFKGAQYFLHHRKWCGREDETEKCDICGHDLKAMWIHIHKRSHAAKEKAKASQEDGTEPSSKKKRKAATVALKTMKEVTLGEIGKHDEEKDENQDGDWTLTGKDIEADDDDVVEDKESKSKSSKSSTRLIAHIPSDIFKEELERLSEKAVTEVHGNLRPLKSDWIPLPIRSAKEYYPPMHESSKFSIWRENSGSDPSTLQWGKAAGDKTQATGFTGGRIWGMEWCPQGHSGVSRQVIAVTTMADVDSVLMKSLWEGLGLIQFWDAGTLNCRAPPDCHTLELAFCIAHDYGHVLSMCWCPEGAFDSGNPEESFFQRLGLLAAACSDGNIRIYSIPDVNHLFSEVSRAEKSSTPIFKPPPSETLISTDSSDLGPCLSVSWQKQNGCDFIAGGFANGYIHLWHLSTASKWLRRAPKVLAPCRVFFGHHDAVTSIDWSTSVATQFVTGSWDRSVKVWDTKNAKSFIFAMPGPSEAGSTIGPVRQVLLSSPSYYNLIVADEVFSRLCRGHCKGFDLSDGLTDTNAWILNCEASPMAISYSPWYNVVASGDSSGTVLLSVCRPVFIRKKIRKSINAWKLFSIAGVDMKADDKTSNPDDIWFPITEKEASEKLCIKFVDNQLKIDGQYQPGNRTATAEILEGIPFAYVNTVSLNPNLLSSHWIACGTRSGFLRVIHIPLLSELSETARKFFS